MYTCSKCQKDKPLFDFYKDKTKKEGITSYCKPCSKEKRKVRYLTQTETELKDMRERYHKNKEQYRESWLKNTYGLEPGQYNEMFNAQQGCCKICNTHQTQLKRKLFVDHCHETGAVRGLLCQPCNTLLGQAKDDITILQNAIAYLKK
jgi:hypothetical protein